MADPRRPWPTRRPGAAGRGASRPGRMSLMQPGPTRPLAWLAALLTFALVPLVAPVLAAPLPAPPGAADAVTAPRPSALAAAPRAPGRALAQEDPLLPEDPAPTGAAGATP